MTYNLGNHSEWHDCRSGSIAAFLNEKSRVLITHGASADGRLLNDSWLLDLNFGYAEQVISLPTESRASW